MRFLRVTALTLVVTASCLAALASAHVVKYPTGSLSIGYTNSDDPANDEMDYFSGKVEATKPACSSNRKVVIWGDVPGVDVQVGEDRTTSSGEYKVLGEDVAAGTYYAEADRKTLKLTVDHRHVCRAVRSQDIAAAP